MTGYLLDLNLLLALAWPTHVHHSLAHRWFRRHSAKGWGTCALTQTGFVRISANPAFTRDAVTPLEALDLLGQITRLPHHSFWAEHVEATEVAALSMIVIGHRQVTDAYLLALAIGRGGRLATLDRGVASLLPPDSPHLEAVEIVA